ncbi:MAG: putative rane protein [Acidimicrobiales bacterium]|jgi:membrane associated rhomboid family serine protease|nr:putative rane protein [Acidimicrobiales bacterium]
MRPAAVGFQCPSCVAEGNKTVRPARTFFGAPMGAEPRATQALLAINVVVFLIQQVKPSVTTDFALIPPFVAQGEWYRLITSAFLHNDVIHIGFNMVLLWLVGHQLERALGWPRFVAMYFVAGFGGGAASYLMSPLNIAGLGASGAVFGLLGGYFMIGRRVGADTSQVTMLIVLNLLLGFVVPHIDYWAHIGGLATGAAVAAAYAYIGPGRAQLARQAAVVGVVVLALVSVVGLRTAQINRQVRFVGSPAPAVQSRISAAPRAS